VLAYTNQLMLHYLFLNLVCIRFEIAFLDGSFSHGSRQKFEIEIRNISFVSLEVWIVTKVFIELVSA
jgi:hypothetical protein